MVPESVSIYFGIESTLKSYSLSNSLSLSLSLSLSSPSLVVITTLTQTGFRRLEGAGRITVCVVKDLETAVQINVTLQTINGTAQRMSQLTSLMKSRDTCAV